MTVYRICKSGFGLGLGLVLAAGSHIGVANAAGPFDPGRPIFETDAKSWSSRDSGKQDPQAARAERYSSLINKYAKAHGLPVALAHAVVRIESNFNAGARGGVGEVGLMQIKPATARLMGYAGGTKALYDPATNLQWGMKYLAGAYKLANGDTCGTILRYNAGHYAKRMNPISARYCSKVKAVLKTTKIVEPVRRQAFLLDTRD
jgi:soluble lytic murein transglycosylase-like protein